MAFDEIGIKWRVETSPGADMAPNWAEIVQAIAASATALIAFAGIVFVVLQLRQVDRSVRSATQERLTSESFEIITFLSSIPGSYPYFYEGKLIPEGEPNLERLRYAAEMVLNFMEHLVLQRGNLKDDWRVWRVFIVQTFISAPIVRAHFEANRGIYTEKLDELAEEADQLARGSAK